MDSGEDAQTGHPTRPQAIAEPEAYPQGYVEDFDEPRAKLAGFFSLLLGEVVLRHAVSKGIAGDLEESAGFGDVAACLL